MAQRKKSIKLKQKTPEEIRVLNSSNDNSKLEELKKSISQILITIASGVSIPAAVDIMKESGEMEDEVYYFIPPVIPNYENSKT